MKVLFYVFAHLILKNVRSYQHTLGVVNLFEKANNAFSAKFLDAVVQLKHGQNVVVSGFLVLKPLAQLSIGAVGKAHTELLKAIGMPDDDVTKIVFPIVYNRISQEDDNPSVSVKIASKFYIPMGYKLNEDYQIDMNLLFHTQVQNIDFKKNLVAAKEINNWVENQTDNKIQNLIHPSSVAGDTALVLVNAIYFKGRWNNTFQLKNTVYRDFYSNKTFFTKLRTMFKRDNLKYGESDELDAQLLELPYEANDFTLLVILPRQVDGLSSLLSKLHNQESFEKAINAMSTTEVNVFLPRMKIETRHHLKNSLEKLGVEQIFKSINSGLDNILSSGSIFVSDAVDQVLIEINEEGTEAAGANAFLGSKSALIGKIFRANHPFVFYLKCGPTTIFNGIFLGYGDRYVSRNGEPVDEGTDLRISFDVPFDVSYLPTCRKRHQLIDWAHERHQCIELGPRFAKVIYIHTKKNLKENTK